MLRSLSKGFTIIELLVAIAIIGILASIVISNVSSARQKARDNGRIAQLKQIQTQLDLYFDANGVYPNPSSADCSGWSAGNSTYTNFLTSLSPWKVPLDTAGTGCNDGFYYYKYGAGSNGCPASKGDHYVLGMDRNLSIAKPANTVTFGIAEGCTRDWGTEFRWVTGKFEKV